MHHDAARVRERLGQTDRAEELYRAILRLRSDDPVAIKRVEEICRDQQRWEDLANILEQRTGSPTEALPNGPERRARLRELAGLYEERLERPYEAIDTLERLLRESSDEERGGAEAPPPVDETLAAHEALTRLYSRIGLWSKVVESLQSRADLTEDKAKARALRVEVAAVYEKELALPDRAIEAYEAVLAEIPDDAQALEALDRLHEASGRFDDLQEILQRRAALAKDGEKIEIVRRRVKILQDRLNNPEAAAGALRELGPEAIADDDLLSVLLRNLRRAGLAHEASRVLTQRIDLERGRKGGANKARITELNLELSLLKLDDLERSDRGAQGGRGGAAGLARQPRRAGRARPPAPQGQRLRRLFFGAPARGQGAGRQARGRGGAAGRRAASTASSSTIRPRRATPSRRRCAKPPTAPRRSTRWPRSSLRRQTGTRRAACSPAAGDHQ